jgi:phage/plasmid-like protein (TIGR03299 family)
MPAYFDAGFSVRRPSWHGLATVLDDYPVDWADARVKAGLEWEPTYRDLYTLELLPPGTTVPDGHRALEGQPELKLVADLDDPDADPQWVTVVETLVAMPVDGHQAIIRDDTRATLATPSDQYELIFHRQMGEMLEAYTEAWRKAGAKVNFETAGSVRGGRMVWALVWLDEGFTVPGDDSETYPFGALLNAHDGTAACKLMPTQVRVICWNTWHAADMAGERSGHQVVIRHVQNASERLDEAKESLSAMRDDARAYQLQAADLAGININDAVVRTFLDEFIPIPEAASERTRNARLDRQSTFMGLYNESPTVAPLPETAYKLTQAAGEYLDHLRPFRSRDTYLARTMLQGDTFKPGVVTLVRDLAKEMA